MTLIEFNDSNNEQFMSRFKRMTRERIIYLYCDIEFHETCVCRVCSYA